MYATGGTHWLRTITYTLLSRYRRMVCSMSNLQKTGRYISILLNYHVKLRTANTNAGIKWSLSRGILLQLSAG
jgi:hypothetical protein